jgi:putative hemolysin
VPKSKRADSLLDEMRTTRCHVAVVIEESGGTAGIVTLRDIIGGLVGRIESELPPDTPAAERRDASGAMLLDGLTRIEEFEELTGLAAASAVPAKIETLGGLIMALTGRIPLVGDLVQVDGRTLEVTERDGMRVSRVRLHPAPTVVEPADEIVITG